jgi:hypothetical protein
MRRKQWIAVAAIGISLLFVEGASAGSIRPGEVWISSEGIAFNGSVTRARDSADSVQRIGCYSETWGNGLIFGSCFARDTQGRMASCHTYNALQIAQIQAVGPSSYINVQLVRDTGRCTFVSVDNASENL